MEHSITPQQTLNSEQLELIKKTVARGATDDELKLFLYRCKNLGLDPLRPNTVHFIKYGSSPGTVVVGLDGFRSLAARTGKHTGTKRGLIYSDDGSLVGAWAEVYRSDWQHPAREESLISEYSTGKAMWAKMPATMIKKVAEVAALRMAFPDELGGVYSDDEMHQATPTQKIDPEPVRDVTKPSPEAIRSVFDAATRNGWNRESLAQLLDEQFHVKSASELSIDQFRAITTLVASGGK